MSRKTDTNLQTQFDVIRDETIRGANDESRVSGAYSDLKDSSQLLPETVSFTTSVSFDTNKWFATYSMSATLSFTYSGTGDYGKSVEGIVMGDGASGLTFSSDFIILTDEFDNTSGTSNYIRMKYQDTGIWTEIMTEGNFASPGGGGGATINNPLNNRILTSDGGTDANAEPNLTFDDTTGVLGLSGSIQFSTASIATVVEGGMSWNTEDGTVDIGLNGGEVVLQLGQEMHYRVRNNSSETINNGDFVMATGTIGSSGIITVSRAISDGTIDSKFFIGVATHDILDDVDGYVTSFGKVRGIDTTGTSVGEVWNEEDVLYSNPGFTGSLTNVEPVAPLPVVVVALVITKHASNGTLMVRIHNHHPVGHSSDILNYDPDTLSDGAHLVWDSTGKYFEAATFSIQINSFTSSLSFDQSNWYDTYTMSSNLSFTQSGVTPTNGNSTSFVLVADGSSTLSFSDDFVLINNEFDQTLNTKHYCVFIYQPDGTIWTTISLST